jgi:catechol 2,3-dioxygenase-like lactoylglutathione lyase family enzyme
MSSDIAESLRFYARLGFREISCDSVTDPRYAGVSRDGAELHLQWHDQAQWANPSDRPTYRFLVVDVDALYAEIVQSGAIAVEPSPQSPWASPGDTPWGTREFHLRDPGGNGLHFYEPVRGQRLR